MNDSELIVQTVREQYPAVRRITELTNINDIENNTNIENESYIVLANSNTQKNYKKQISDIKQEIEDNLHNNLTSINNKLSNLESNINSINNNFNQINNRFNDLENALNMTNNKLDNFESTTNTNFIEADNKMLIHHAAAMSAIQTVNDKVDVLDYKLQKHINECNNNPEPDEQIIYYFWIISDLQLNYLNNDTNTINNELIQYNVNSTVNKCPFEDNKSYNVINILQEQFVTEYNEKAYLILPKSYISYNDTNDTILYINNKQLKSNGFILNVDKIYQNEYKLTNDVYEVNYVLIELMDELSTGLTLNI